MRRYICHELRNPLHAIQGLVDVQMERESFDGASEIMEMCAHMRTILDDMLELTKVARCWRDGRTAGAPCRECSR